MRYGKFPGQQVNAGDESFFHYSKNAANALVSK